MIPVRVALRGFMSYRDEAEIVFDGAPLWVLAGRNGAGKSAIFDAITYALYGVHRAGTQNAKALVNRGSKGLDVEFDFRSGDAEYRVKRTLSLKGTPTVQAFELAPEPRPIPETETKAGFDRWVLDTIGLDARTFTASVLLQQGRSEALLEADPKARHEMLSQIIDLSAYERLYDRAEEIHKESRALAESLHTQLGGLDPVEENEISRASDEVGRAEAQVVSAREEIEQLTALGVHAAQWERLEEERREIESAIEEGERLLARVDEIERDAARLADLERAIPAVARLLDERDRLAELERSLRDHEAEAAEQAARLAREREARERAVAERERVERARDAAGARASGLAAALPWARSAIESLDAAQRAERQIVEATARERDLEAAISKASLELERLRTEREMADAAAGAAARRAAETAAVLAEARRRQARFGEIDGRASCGYCGQPLTSEHLEAERARLAREVEAASRAAEDAVAIERDAASAAKEVAERLERAERGAQSHKMELQAVSQALGTARNEYEKERARLALALENLPESIASNLGGEALSTLREQQSQAEADRSRAGDELEALKRSIGAGDEAVADAERRHVEATMEIRSGQSMRQELLRTIAGHETALPDGWRDSAASLTRDELDTWRVEAEALAPAAGQIERLETARRERRSREARLEAIAREIASMPEAARRRVAEIKQEEDVARSRFGDAEARRDRAQRERHDLVSRRERRGAIESQFLETSRRESLYHELARLLGRDRLQRHLLQQAETAIVSHANEVLDRLSSGTIWLELKTLEKGAERKGMPKALDLVAYNSLTGDDPIPVALLSGSQRFRVAVSLALAIGRYASHGGRRIESVIIDEGFGSLDREGRREMIDELHALKSTLERIVLVSHQEEIAEAFSNKYYVELVEGSSRARLEE